ncbi:NAD-dependent succinate-semialdehyde dehydrogenase [Vibrio sp. EA2]|uniref:NAD-dependent succinate-semialdehyde dehydrogenase n=1 Tax=Vibrio sp. EA2 TaxID=3079860 RepID=UPI002949EC70|nr:NAD-dependent succinate-semialdehyde dehydrogenase [Vibrio sp. EA2]MDV6252855.1 NAD-dependent succinate-semialdehyde dehydrogenase [Vibrio sp. EA2]
MKLSNPNLYKQQCFINGKWLSAENGETSDVLNPFDNTIIGSVPKMGRSETSEAIKSAQVAFKLWKITLAGERSLLLKKWYQLIVENIDDLATIITTELGKPFEEAKGEVMYAASFVEWFAEEAKRAYGEIVPTHRSDSRIVTTQEPIGVVAAITPWNFPIAMITRKCAPAFAAGCTVVLKPAPETPFTALALAELAKQAGFPDGVLSVVTGDAIEIGKELTENKRVKKVSFTGSTRVGKILMQQSAASIKKLSLELGGNAPFIVFDDADLDAAVEGTMIAKFRNAGQTCVCANRIYVHDSVYDTFAQKLIERVSKLKVGNGFEKETMIGPLINHSAVDKVKSHIEDAVSKGAEVGYGTESHPLGNNFVIPHVLLNVTDEMLVSQEETFGPVAPLFRFDSEEEVISRANDTDFGLSAYLYTESHSRVWRVSEALEAGIVGVNQGLISTPVAPFGGVKESGLGREGSHMGLTEFMEVKYILMGGLN